MKATMIMVGNGANAPRKLSVAEFVSRWLLEAKRGRDARAVCGALQSVLDNVTMTVGEAELCRLALDDLA